MGNPIKSQDKKTLRVPLGAHSSYKIPCPVHSSAFCLLHSRSCSHEPTAFHWQLLALQVSQKHTLHFTFFAVLQKYQPRGITVSQCQFFWLNPNGTNKILSWSELEFSYLE